MKMKWFDWLFIAGLFLVLGLIGGNDYHTEKALECEKAGKGYSSEEGVCK